MSDILIILATALGMTVGAAVLAFGLVMFAIHISKDPEEDA